MEDGAPAHPAASPESDLQKTQKAIEPRMALPGVNSPAITDQAGTDPGLDALRASLDLNPAQNHDRLPEIDQLNNDKPSTTNAVQEPDHGDSHPEHPETCLQGESAETAITLSSCSPIQFTSAANRRRVNSASLTSPEMDPLPTQVAIPSKKGTIQADPCGAFCPEPCWQDALAETANTPSSSFVAVASATVHPSSPISGEKYPAQKKEDAPDGRDSAVDPHQDAAHPGPSRITSRVAAPSARRSKTGKSFAVSAGRRGLHPLKASIKVSDRKLQNRLALARPDALPLQIPRIAALRGRKHPRAPKTPPAARDQNQVGKYASRNRRVPEGPQGRGRAETAAVQGRIPTLDMEGIPHVVGGLVEASVGRKDLLFAKQVPGDPSDVYNSLKVLRHEFFAFPPPDMIEHNRAFERVLEESRPTFWGFHPDIIDQELDGYAAQTKRFEGLMEEHEAEFDLIYKSFSAIKEQLTHLNYERERVITSAYAPKPKLGPMARRKRLDEIAAEEFPLVRELEVVQPALQEIIMRGRRKIAHALKQDLRAPKAIDDRRTRAGQRIIVEEREKELGVAGATIGVRCTPQQQSVEACAAILRYTRLVVDERMELFDEPDELHKARAEKVAKRILTGESTPVNRTPNIDTVITTIPDWFTILDAKGTVPLYGETPLARFKELTNSMAHSSWAARDEQWDEEARPDRNSWRKEYHEPHRSWPNAKQRSRGGWWLCRSGPDASAAERNCKLCHTRDATAAQRPRRTSAATHKHILDEVEKAMAEANKRDRLMLKYQLQQEREDLNRYWQQREWSRSGGGADLNQVLHDRGVNELNYRPSIGRSQSWQPQGAVSKAQEGHGTLAGLANGIGRIELSQSLPAELQEPFSGKQVEAQNSAHKAHDQEDGRQDHELLHGHMSGTFASQAGPSQSPQRRPASRFDELLYGAQVSGNHFPHTAGISQPTQHLASPNRGYPLLSGRHVGESTSPQAGLSRPPRNSSGTPRVHPLLSGGHFGGIPSSPAADPAQLSHYLGGVPQVPSLLSGGQPNSQGFSQTAPPVSLHRFHSSQAHDLLHGRQSANEASSPAQAGSSQLRPVLLRPGQKSGKEKRVSWQY